jgi:hypothetical protein
MKQLNDWLKSVKGMASFFFEGDGESTNMICLWHDDPYGQ